MPDRRSLSSGNGGGGCRRTRATKRKKPPTHPKTHRRSQLHQLNPQPPPAAPERRVVKNLAAKTVSVVILVPTQLPPTPSWGHMTLSNDHDPAALRAYRCLDAVVVDAGRDSSTTPIATIPADLVQADGSFSTQKMSDESSPGIVDKQIHVIRLLQIPTQGHLARRRVGARRKYADRQMCRGVIYVRRRQQREREGPQGDAISQWPVRDQTDRFLRIGVLVWRGVTRTTVSSRVIWPQCDDLFRNPVSVLDQRHTGCADKPVGAWRHHRHESD